MGTAFLSNCQAVNIFQFPSLFLIFQPDFSNQLRKIFLHLFPCRAFPLLICESHPVIARREVPLDQSPNIPFPSPLILFGNLFRSGLLSLFSFLSPSSIPWVILCCVVVQGSFPAQVTFLPIPQNNPYLHQSTSRL